MSCFPNTKQASQVFLKHFESSWQTDLLYAISLPKQV